MINYENPTATVVWQQGENRVIRLANGKHYAQHEICGKDGFGWYDFSLVRKSYKTVAGAKKVFSQK